MKDLRPEIPEDRQSGGRNRSAGRRNNGCVITCCVSVLDSIDRGGGVEPFDSVPVMAIINRRLLPNRSSK